MRSKRVRAPGGRRPNASRTRPNHATTPPGSNDGRRAVLKHDRPQGAEPRRPSCQTRGSSRTRRQSRPPPRREAYNRSAMSLPPFGARSGRSRVPSRRRRPPFRAALEPRPPPARLTFSAASKTTRVVLCCQISVGAGAVSLTPIKLLSIGCVRGDRCWCGAQRTRSRRDAPHPRAGESRARAACAWVPMTLREVLEEVEKLSPTGSSSLWWSQRTVPRCAYGRTRRLCARGALPPRA